MKLSTLPIGVQNIVRTYDSSYFIECQNGIQWYANAYEIASKLSSKYSVDINQVVGVMAALSPNNEWQRNCIDAENLLRMWSNFKDSSQLNYYCDLEDRYFFHNAFSVFKTDYIKENLFDERLSGKEDRYWANDQIENNNKKIKISK